MEKYLTKAQIQSKKVLPFNKIEWDNMLSQMNGKEVVITIERFYNRRSLKQNAYYWGVIIPTVCRFYKDAYGENISRQDMHEFHMSKVGGIKAQVKEILGEIIISEDGKTSSAMNTKEFANFIEEVYKFWAEAGCYIPDAKEVEL